MRRLALWVLPVLVAGCGDDSPKLAAAPPSPQEQACAAQANDDPALREARAISAGRLDWEWQHAPEIAQIKRDAITRCLKGRGLAARGGVERQR